MKKPQPTANIRTPTGMLLARRALGLSAKNLSLLLGLNGEPRTVYKWESGETPVPGPVAKLLVFLLKERGLWPVRAPIPLARVPSSETSPDQP